MSGGYSSDAPPLASTPPADGGEEEPEEVSVSPGFIPDDDDRLKAFIQEGEPDPDEVIEERGVEMGGFCDKPLSEQSRCNYRFPCYLMSALNCVSSNRKQGCKLFGKVSPHDIHQRSYGDCWLLSAIAALAEFPGAIDRIFNHETDLNPNGYNVTLYNLKDGSPNIIHIDDRIPATQYYRNASRPHASRGLQITDDGEIWPPLLEKAAAIHCGGYHHIGEGSLPFIGFKILTGCSDIAFLCMMNGSWTQTEPVHTYPRNGPCSSMGRYRYSGNSRRYNLDQLFDLLHKADRANWPMCCGADHTKHGILGGHAYTLIGAAKVDGFKLLHIRNPHGNTADEWTGAWGDHSAMWEKHPRVKAALSPDRKKDGAYWMSVQDFSAHFTGITLLMKSFSRAAPLTKQAARWESVAEPNVRAGKSLSSEKLGSLGKFTVVEEKERDGNRLCFKKIAGEGPDEGWVSIAMNGGKTILTMPLRRRWGVCNRGGATVREEIGTKSKELGCLGEGAVIAEEERNGNRVRFEKISGDGPNSGWASILVGKKRLLHEHDVEEEEEEEEQGFTQHDGYISQGHDIAVRTMTVEDAKDAASQMPSCVGFTFQGGMTDKPVHIYFKGKWDVQGSGWTSFKKL